jgi:hypothetical protein
MKDISFLTGEIVVEAYNEMPLQEQPFTQMGTQKTRSAGDKYPFSIVAEVCHAHLQDKYTYSAGMENKRPSILSKTPP